MHGKTQYAVRMSHVNVATPLHTPLPAMRMALEAVNAVIPRNAAHFMARDSIDPTCLQPFPCLLLLDRLAFSFAEEATLAMSLSGVSEAKSTEQAGEGKGSGGRRTPQNGQRGSRQGEEGGRPTS